MKHAFFRSIFSSRAQGIAACALLTGTAMLLMQFPAPAQDEGAGLRRAKAPTGPAAKLADGKPDLSGVWSPDRTFIYDINEALKKGDTLPIQPWALELTKKRPSVEDPEANCLPTGVPRMAPYPWSIAQSPTNVYFLFEGNIHSYRTIFMDGRKHSADPNPSWYGESIGHYEGQTLVIDTIGFNDKFWFDFAGHPHTEKLHITERYRRPDLGHLEWESVIDDPGAYTRPFTMYGHSTLQQNTDLMEYICQENNKDLSHIIGKDARNKYAREEEKAASKAVYGGR